MSAPYRGRPLRILFTAYRGNMQCGGQGAYLWFLTRELARLGHRVEVLVGPPYPDPMPFAERLTPVENGQYWANWFLGERAAFAPPGARLRALGPLHFYELAASRLGFLPEPFAFSLRALRGAAARIRCGARFDLVHDVQCLGYGLLPLRSMGLPLVGTVHHPLSIDRRASFQRDRNFREAIGTMQFYPLGMQAFVARRFARILTSSLASARALRRDFGVERVAMVANGLDTDIFCPDPDVQKQGPQLLCVGRASDPNKGVRTLVEALARLPESVQLTLVDDPNTQALCWARELGCAGRLHVAGRVSLALLVQLYRQAQVVVVPSRFEGFGLPAAEAMACGTPVVASRAGALLELLAQTGGGAMVPRDNPEALAEALRALLENPARRAELGARGRAGVVEHYAWPKVAARTVQEYRAVLAERRRGVA